jgi:hypothetical protein
MNTTNYSAAVLDNVAVMHASLAASGWVLSEIATQPSGLIGFTCARGPDILDRRGRVEIPFRAHVRTFNADGTMTVIRL